MKLRPIHNWVYFKFVDEAVRAGFIEKTSFGLVLPATHTTAAKDARWGVVTAVGSAVTEFKPGDEILINATMWSSRIKVDDDVFWRTDTDQIIATRDPETA